MDDRALNLRLHAACSIAAEAGALARHLFLNRPQGDYALKGPQDYLTEADGAVEALVRERLATVFPDDGMIGEETGGSSAAATWIVDPIDGTANFARGVPHFCVSIGLLVDGRPELGAIAAPMQSELYAARRSRGASLNGRPIRAAATGALSEAVVELGWSPRRPAADYLTMTERVLASGASVRRAGSGTLGLAYVAAGRSDGYAELNIRAWDVLAGLVLVAEAGGLANDFFAGPDWLTGAPVLVAAPGIGAALSEIVGIPLSTAGS
ncbi:inositol monophosphatase family protein [Prosthecomicrobium hirschii]|uniref:inositol monophosphatase family protein n=1 Tax=Prosthecodimorpha hirschii TaxID=665126 RepID=UPI00221EEE01|nr:inositol monophosphatase family protein [Prosthecomicrobium hirschii]MCW1838984.1 inositol monophosphatase [Prosthecomicrobium hirschii]